MQTLAAGVGDLKKVLTNVKTRGTWGEVQLENLLEQMLTPAQYSKNVATRPGPVRNASNSRSACPGEARHGDHAGCRSTPNFRSRIFSGCRMRRNGRIWRAVDVSSARRSRTAFKKQAKDIREKYIEPPHTTDFALLYLPVESLYAEVLSASRPRRHDPARATR